MKRSDATVLQRLAENVVQTAAVGRDVVEVGPFRAFFARDSDLIHLNYAVPVAPCEDWSGPLADLRHAFEARGRVLRFEYLDALWPTLRPALEHAGLRLELAAPVMALTPAELVARSSPEVAIRVLEAGDPDADFALHAHLGAAGFQMPLPAPPEISVPRDRARAAEGGLLAAIAWRRGEPAGAGSLLIGGEVAELAGIATLPAHRGRGVAAALCSGLIEAGFARGLELVWLSAGDEPAQALYRTLGFGHLGEQLNYGLPRLTGPGGRLSGRDRGRQKRPGCLCALHRATVPAAAGRCLKRGGSSGQVAVRRGRLPPVAAVPDPHGAHAVHHLRTRAVGEERER